jgi:hypothetical protein
MKKTLIALLVLFTTTAALADGRSADIDRLESSATVIQEIMSAPDSGVPEEVISKAKCIAVIPSMLKAAFVFGGAYGKGVASCRTEKGWSAPAFFSLKGGSFGFQIGGQAADIVMLVMNDQGMNGLLASKVKLGADASVAAGLEDASRIAYLFACARSLRRNLAQRRRPDAAQGRHPRFLWPHGSLQDNLARQHRIAQGSGDLARYAGEIRRKISDPPSAPAFSQAAEKVPFSVSP